MKIALIPYSYKITPPNRQTFESSCPNVEFGETSPWRGCRDNKVVQRLPIHGGTFKCLAKPVPFRDCASNRSLSKVFRCATSFSGIWGHPITRPMVAKLATFQDTRLKTRQTGVSRSRGQYTHPIAVIRVWKIRYASV